MKRVATAVAVTAALVVAGVAAFTSSSASAKPAAKSATKLTVWVGWTARELGEFKKVVAEYDAKHADVDIKVVGNISDDKIIAAIKSGNAPDVVSSFSSSNVGIYCGTGAWIDLAPYLKKDKVDINQFPAASRYYTQYEGKRCALPLLADTWGLYYNKKLFKAAGLTRPPKTFSELTAYAKKLTQKGSDGSLKVVGFDPEYGFYQNVAANWAPLYGASWVDSEGKSSLSKDPDWAKGLRWQKSLVDYYGHDKLVRWQSGIGQEFTASQAFEIGKLAMNMDGEWRVAFIAAEHPELDYATAPMPVADNHPEIYGGADVNGTIIGIPKGGSHGDQAWALVKYLTTNNHALAKFSNGIRNVPSTKASAKSPELKPDPHFATFLSIFNHPKSATNPITAVGNAYTELFQSFLVKWQAGKVKDLPAGLKKVDKQIDDQLAQAKKGGGVP